ncbi:MAG: RDD family protein [Betaproteobacteria bacterium]|nr:RDD family protein [Betaproteobacteria bacterium]
MSCKRRRYRPWCRAFELMDRQLARLLGAWAVGSIGKPRRLNDGKSMVNPIVPASVWRRFVCMGYEAFLLVGPILVISFLYAWIIGQDDRHPGLEDAKRLGLQMTIFIAGLAYFRWGWSEGRVTLPMQTLALVIEDASTGEPISRGRALARAALGSLFVFTGLWLAALFRRDRQTPYDLILGTRLRHAPRPRTPH